MEFHPLPILAFLTLALVTSHAALAPQLYWKSVLPNTPIPKAIRDILQPDKSTTVKVGKGAVNVNSVEDRTRLLQYTSGSAENQRLSDPDAVIFFLEKDMHTGTTMNLHFTENSNMASFLPRQVAKSIPFSSNKLQDIFNQFSVKPGSVEAEIMANAIKLCEEPRLKGEDKYCATSLESMIDFSTSKLGKNLQAISTEVENQTQMQKYTIADGVKKMGDKSVVCHKQNYAYAVFYCHIIQTRAYMVPLEGADGTKVKGVAVCHTDTSAWSPKLLAFQVLKVKPGTVPICHFIYEGTILWIANQSLQKHPNPLSYIY